MPRRDMTKRIRDRLEYLRAAEKRVKEIVVDGVSHVVEVTILPMPGDLPDKVFREIPPPPVRRK